MERLDYFDRIENHPKPGITFYDLQGVLRNPNIWERSQLELGNWASTHNPTAIMAADARGFLMAGFLAPMLNCKVILCRKPGKLPPPTVGVSYGTEYSRDSIEIRSNQITKGDRVLLVDDVLATGGTAKAMKDLAEMHDAEVVAMVTLLEIRALKGRERLGLPTHAWTFTE